MPLTKITQEEIKAVMGEYRMANADVHIRCDPTLDEFIDVIEGGRVYIPCVSLFRLLSREGWGRQLTGWCVVARQLYVLNKIGASLPLSPACPQLRRLSKSRGRR